MDDFNRDYLTTNESDTLILRAGADNGIFILLPVFYYVVSHALTDFGIEWSQLQKVPAMNAPR